MSLPDPSGIAQTEGMRQLFKLVASGLGSTLATFIAPWRARREGKARVIAAKSEAEALQILTEAHSRALQPLVDQGLDLDGEIELDSELKQRILYQLQKKQTNIASVVSKAADALEGKQAPDEEPDHDWTARFFEFAEDVSSEQLQILWAKVLAGEVQRSGSTSMRTLGILRDLDRNTAGLFTKLCSASILFMPAPGAFLDARVPSLGGNAASNSLRDYGLGFDALNRLNEHGLVIPDYNSYYDYRLSIITPGPRTPTLPFLHQDHQWVLVSEQPWNANQELQIHGVAMTTAGRELSRVVKQESLPKYTQNLKQFFLGRKLKMLMLSETN